ncbi:DUF2934 domain-containing protein [Sinorhizobium sp. BG8]|uniref:DUF2934 domain-containing protein n=1 Tax=Sinorhizobium sp. BG8 TaxID=2613773 RepID=UPI00193E1DB9|nr:DUF2934 domain-containing protein [Sinorhizobium sp. BG8]QRM57388.1 DUF2934 domain-containing protein [Sinorhizobium sp. BG8]
MSDARLEWIRKRAYAIWEAEGRPHGRDAQHWEQASRERDDLERVALPDYLEKGKKPRKAQSAPRSSATKVATKADKETEVQAGAEKKAPAARKKNASAPPTKSA